MTSQQRYEKCLEIVAYLATIALEQRQQALNDRLNTEIDDEYDRKTLFLVIAAQIQITRETTLAEMALWEKITATVGGAGFLIALLVIAVLIPEPTDFQIFVFRLILAVAAGAFGSVIPGFLAVDGEVKKFSIRAGGALALFVIVYFLNPPALIHR
jgi:hypothetical protein